MELPIIYPMNAKADEKRLEIAWQSEDYVAEEKFDGSRYLMYLTPNGSRFFSRRKSDITNMPVEKTGNLPHLNNLSYKDGLIILDGEIVTELKGTSSNNVTSIMGSLPDRAIKLQLERGWVKYVVFDVLYVNGLNIMSFPWKKRRSYLEKKIGELVKSNKYISIVPVVFKDKEKFYEQIVENGGEGIILKNINGVYIPDKRPVDNWIKVKKYGTFDVVITGYDNPKREYEGKYVEDWPYWEADNGIVFFDRKTALESGLNVTPVTKFHAMGWIGAVRFGMFINGKLTEIGQTSGMDESVRKELSENKEKYIGKVIEVGAMEMIKKTHALRHPRFLRYRPDKSPQDCVLPITGKVK